MNYKFILLCISIILLANNIYTSNKTSYIKGGGYLAVFCFNYNFNISLPVKKQTNIPCWNSNEKCNFGNYFICNLPCKFDNTLANVNKTKYELKGYDKPKFEISKEKYLQNGNNLIISVQNNSNISSIFPKQIKINFSNKNVVCQQISIKNNSIICLLSFTKSKTFYQSFKVSVNISYGNINCNPIQNIGTIVISDGTYYLLIPIFIIIFLIFGIILIIYKRFFKRKIEQNINKTHSTEIVEQEMKYMKLNKIAFLEYQTAIDSFKNLGRLNPRHLLSFNDYVSRTFNIELLATSNESEKADLSDIKSILLNKPMLLKWIEELNKSQRAQERSLIASLLTIVLFQHPEYFLEIIKDLLIQLVCQMKKNSEEKILFRRSEAIVEKMVGNWITLCLYQSLKIGEIGKKLFYLYRAIKCKMESGIIDVFTKRSKFGLSFDQLLIGNLDYDVLNIQVNVKVQIPMLDSTVAPLNIDFDNLDLEVLSVDSISQIKTKILDKVIMEFVESENLEINISDDNYAIDLGNFNRFLLYFITKSAKILLDDFDNTSETTVLDKEYTQVNTLKHYGIKNGSQFLLVNNSYNDSSFDIRESVSLKSKYSIHLHTLADSKSPNFDSKVQGSLEKKNLPVKIITDDSNKESCLMLLLATKKSINPFIDGFFQCIFNRKMESQLMTSSNSLFEAISDNLLSSNSEDHYIMFAQYYFNMLNDIGIQMNIVDQSTIQIWKSNSFILRFWINIVKNPNFIFSISKSEYIDTCLTTIASVLMESCSIDIKNINMDSPIFKQLFQDEVQKKYSNWWRIFSNSIIHVEEESIISMMNDISERYKMKNNYNSSLKSLLTISNGLSIQLPKQTVELIFDEMI